MLWQARPYFVSTSLIACSDRSKNSSMIFSSSINSTASFHLYTTVFARKTTWKEKFSKYFCDSKTRRYLFSTTVFACSHRLIGGFIFALSNWIWSAYLLLVFHKERNTKQGNHNDGIEGI